MALRFPSVGALSAVVSWYDHERANRGCEVGNCDEQDKSVTTGRQLMETGVSIAIAVRPGATVVIYESVQEETP